MYAKYIEYTHPVVDEGAEVAHVLPASFIRRIKHQVVVAIAQK